MAMKEHPDSHLNNAVEATKKWAPKQHAYDILSCPTARKEYDSPKSNAERARKEGAKAAREKRRKEDAERTKIK